MTDMLFYAVLQATGTTQHLMFAKICILMHSCCEKLVFRVSDLVRYKPGCTTIEDRKRLEISDLGSRGIVLSV